MGLLDKMMTNPLAMASLGLLSMPTRSREPLNPIVYAMQGAMGAQRMKQMQADQAMQEQQFGMQQQQFQAEQAQLAEQNARRAKIDQFVAQSQDPNLKQLYQFGGPDAAAKYLQDSMKPQEPKTVTVNGRVVQIGPDGAKELYAAPPEPQKPPSNIAAYQMLYPEDKALKGYNDWNRANRAAGAGSLTVKQYPPPPTGYYYKNPEDPAAGLAPLTGGPADPNSKDLTESQANASMFYNRAKEMDGSLNTSNYNASGFTAAKDRAMAGRMLTNWMATPEGQAYISQGKNFVAAVLRKESGAAITEEEWATGQQMYVTMPGDSEALKKQKAKNRQLAIEGLKVAAGPGASRVGAPSAPVEGNVVDFNNLGD